MTALHEHHKQLFFFCLSYSMLAVPMSVCVFLNVNSMTYLCRCGRGLRVLVWPQVRFGRTKR